MNDSPLHPPVISRVAGNTAPSTVTQDALDRTEANLQAMLHSEIRAVREVTTICFAEHERRIGELNNSHAKAVEAKQKSDEAATRVQERTVTTAALQDWKDEVNKALAIQANTLNASLASQAGAANANAKTWSLIMGIVVILVNILIRVVLPT